MTRLIAFAGHKGSGKDTAAEALAEFETVKIAGALKAMLASLLAYQGVPPERIERMLEGDLKEKPSAFLAGRTPRHAMQTLGTAWGRDQMATDFWLQVVECKIAGHDNVVISDVRFPNEVDMVHRLGGYVYRIERPNGAGVDQHPSEMQIDGLAVDSVITNDFPTAERFQTAFGERFFGLQNG